MFLGNLSYDTTQADVQEEFGRFGPIKNISLGMDRFTNRSRGFGFLTFENRADAEKAYEK